MAGTGAASAASRSASNSCAARTRGSPPGPAGSTSAAGFRCGSFSVRLGNSLTPVIASERFASRFRRCSQATATRSRTSPSASARTMPPARSISVNQAHAAWASSSVSDSTYQEPPAGSSTRASDPSSTSRLWVLRAIRRENASGRPSAASNGCTVTTSAPPTPAAKQATVVRSMLTHGSRRVVITDEVTACWRWPRTSGEAPDSSPTRSHRRRAARSAAIVVNWSAVAA